MGECFVPADPLVDVGVDGVATIGEDGIGGRHVHHRHLGGAERQGPRDLEFGLEARDAKFFRLLGGEGEGAKKQRATKHALILSLRS